MFVLPGVSTDPPDADTVKDSRNSLLLVLEYLVSNLSSPNPSARFQVRERPVDGLRRTFELLNRHMTSSTALAVAPD